MTAEVDGLAQVDATPPSIWHYRCTLTAMATDVLTLEVWKDTFRQDCEHNDKVQAFNSMGEECLRVLWNAGTAPSVQGVIDGGNKAV